MAEPDFTKDKTIPPRKRTPTARASIEFSRITYKPRNVFLGAHKTTVRLEPVMWEALGDIADHHGITRQDLIRQIDRDRKRGEGLTSAIRVYIVAFYRDRIGNL